MFVYEGFRLVGVLEDKLGGADQAFPSGGCAVRCRTRWQGLPG